MVLDFLSKKKRNQGGNTDNSGKTTVKKHKKEKLEEIENKAKRDIQKEIKEEYATLKQQNDEVDNKKVKKLLKDKKKKRKKLVKERILMHNDTLDAIAPKGNIKFNDIYFMIDGKYATILTFIVSPGSANKLNPMWGINLIPSIANSKKLNNKNVETKAIYSISRREDSWVKNKIPDAVEISEEGYKESRKASQAIDAKLFEDFYNDAHVIADEVKDNASYLDLSIRITIKASSKEDLNDAIFVLEQYYKDRFKTSVDLVPFVGEMHHEYANMLEPAKHQRGENYMLTSKELAGSYPFIKRGVNDPMGTYVGQLAYEVNSDPVLLDGLNFRNLAVICARDKAEDIRRNSRTKLKKYPYKATTAWSNKIAQDAIIRGNKTIEFVLNGESPQKLRPELMDITAYINLLNERSGINMFQAFSKGMNELNAYNVLIEKIKTITRQFSQQESELDDTGLTKEDLDKLGEIIPAFLEYEGIWKMDAKNRMEDLRLLNLPNDQYPQLNDFKLYLKYSSSAAEGDAALGRGISDLESSKKLYRIFNAISQNHSHLFDRKTTIKREKVRDANRVIFDFKSLRQTAKDALMGHFINTFSFSEQELDEDDVVIIHGMDFLTDSVKKYLEVRIAELNERGVKVVLMYENADILFEEKNKLHRNEENTHRVWFRNADMRITNSMTANNIEAYSELLKIDLPPSITRGMSGSDRYMYFLNRDRESVLFNLEIMD